MKFIATLYAIMDKRPLRALSLLITPLQTAHISKKPCQISSSLVFAAKRDGSQKMQPASSSAINKEGRKFLWAYASP